MSARRRASPNVSCAAWQPARTRDIDCTPLHFPTDASRNTAQAHLADNADTEEIATVCDLLARYGDDALAGAPAATVARRWLAQGFTDAEEIDEWLAARCFHPERAHELERAGLTPEQARLRTSAGSGDYEDTIAYKYERGDLSLEEARRIVTNDFWNG